MCDDTPRLSGCPFCGGKARFMITGHDDVSGLSSIAYNYKIVCDKCGATNNKSGLTIFLFERDGSVGVIQDDRWKVANAWNKREGKNS